MPIDKTIAELQFVILRATIAYYNLPDYHIQSGSSGITVAIGNCNLLIAISDDT